ncbi:HAMP domain-containing histidine kinase [Bacillus atrophaeus]|uniref:HAMP domain-containing histidine kinase n=1 Tax=Bacillus atrophaeus TaxID=1452 RepID=UPI002DB9CEF0|nr:HAMP domain-containing histidine kinase [Bacillus atrophaeus]MEC1900260.1 HAMP domain-containing histidine kinase [Bacillus atrophaeus]MEC2397253.1 HAMP domain-containing histidine kinase [Bacillus atrophaeus]MED4435864.1 HAMP domain-containing histidine kinase [Bacillus atrophaeus]MED4565404.1 HAMP domain-containing histidine kinase [Bacillus atrophaeus]MED4575735.1 HAMP domain-containing histidine kinase [Bacillus atrophaeus]
MTALLIGAVIILAVVNMAQYQMKRSRDRSLEYITKKLNSLTEQHPAGQILLLTDDRKLQALLVQINQLLDDNQKITARFTRTEHSMKRMLTNMSHDLKTPLTVVLGYIEAIQNDSDLADAERKALLEKLHQKTYEIIRLMNSFFDLAKLESGDKEIPITKIHINELCKKNILSFYDVVQAKGYEAAIDIPDIPVYAKGNEEALDRVFQNLLSNAIQYGGDGKVIGLSLSSDEQHVYISVWDRGKGIGEREQERVFERLYTLEESRNKSFQGSGLGLTITKRLVEQMGGAIALQSKPYERTAFIITLKRMTY